MRLPLAALGMIGDRWHADIALGQASSLPSVLVHHGETRPEDLGGSHFKPTTVFDPLGAAADRPASIG